MPNLQPLFPRPATPYRSSADAAARSSRTSRNSSASGSSVNNASAPPPPTTSSANERFDSINASIRSSTVPRHTNLCTSTFRCCPIRNARSVAWFSTAGFHQRSKWITCAAAVRFNPVPPALSDNTKNGGPSARWNASTSPRRFPTGTCPCNTTPGRPKILVRYSASGPVVSRNCVNTSTFSCRAASSSHSSPSRPNFPLSSGRHAPSPVHCEG